MRAAVLDVLDLVFSDAGDLRPSKADSNNCQKGSTMLSDGRQCASSYGPWDVSAEAESESELQVSLRDAASTIPLADPFVLRNVAQYLPWLIEHS